MATLRRAGLRALTIDSTRFDVVGNIGYSLGKAVLEELIGADRFHGFKETPGIPLMELEIRDSGDLDVEDLVTKQDVTITAELVSGKTVILRKASQAGPASQGSEEGAIEVRFVGQTAEEIIAN
jgi:hypothetical protein